jgi:hypothetical protein
MVPIVLVVMSPGPVFFLFLRRQPAEVAPRVPVSFSGPLLVVDDLVVVPNVIIGVIRVVDSSGTV